MTRSKVTWPKDTAKNGGGWSDCKLYFCTRAMSTRGGERYWMLRAYKEGNSKAIWETSPSTFREVVRAANEHATEKR